MAFLGFHTIHISQRFGFQDWKYHISLFLGSFICLFIKICSDGTFNDVYYSAFLGENVAFFKERQQPKDLNSRLCANDQKVSVFYIPELPESACWTPEQDS